MRFIRISQGFAGPIASSNLLHRISGRPNHEKCQQTGHKTDYNCRKWCVAVVGSAHSLFDDLKRILSRKKKKRSTRHIKG